MKKPNVIFILVDDMGYGDFSAFNGGMTDTKALNRMVESGMTFENCYSSSPVCAPARASILTGKYPQRTGVIDTLESRGYDRLKLNETTLADVFKDNGYRTALIGKWHLGSIGDAYHPNKRGFDYFYGFRGGWTDYYDYKNVQRNGEMLEYEGEYLTDALSREAVQYIRENNDAPFFLHLTYNAPHFPYQAPKALFDKYYETGKYTKRVAYIYAMIEAMDNGLGEILDEVKAQKIEENTIIVFTSDNGPDFGSEGEDCGERFNCELRGSKMRVYEGGIKVPAVVCWAENIEAGTVSSEIISHMDWFPTLVGLCGLEQTKVTDVDGSDIGAALKGSNLPERQLYWQWNRHYPVYEGNAAMRDGDYKYVHPPIEPHLDLPRWEIAIDEDIKANPGLYPDLIEAAPPELKIPKKLEYALYNIKEDGREEKNIISKNKDRAKAMEDSLGAWFKKVEQDRML